MATKNYSFAINSTTKLGRNNEIEGHKSLVGWGSESKNCPKSHTTNCLYA